MIAFRLLRPTLIIIGLFVALAILSPQREHLPKYRMGDKFLIGGQYAPITDRFCGEIFRDKDGREIDGPATCYYQISGFWYREEELGR